VRDLSDHALELSDLVGDGGQMVDVTGERMNLPFCMVMEYDDAMFICLY
jgi:hypothetical protein